VVFVMSHESERDFGVITLLFFVAPLSDMQLKNSRVLLSKFIQTRCSSQIHTLSATLGWV
jgi:hypothetical protein